jgi:chromosome segregation ATPase
MTSGYDVYRQFGSVRDDIERDRRKITERMSGFQGEVDTLLREQSGLFKKFATFHVQADTALPALVEKAMDERKAKVAAKKGEVDERTRLISVSKKQVAIFDEKINTLADQIATEEAAIRANFMADERVKPLYIALTAASEAHDDMSRTLEAAKEELASKRVAFEKDELFVYLHGRNFGKPTYRALVPLVRGLDRRLANSFNYQAQAADYDFLVARPGKIEERIASRQPDHDKLLCEYKVLEDEFFDGMKPKHEELEGLKGQRQDAIDMAAEHAQALAAINEFLADAALAQDADLKGIISNFAAMLAKDGFQAEMRAMAAKTASSEDDDIVARLSAIKSKVNSLDDQIEREKSDLAEYERRLDGLRRIEREIDSNNWNGSGHSFNGINATVLADSFLRGMLTEAAVIGQLDDAHRDPPRPRPTDSGSFGGGISSSSSGGFGGFDGGSSTTSSFGGSSSHTTTGGFGGD